MEAPFSWTRTLLGSVSALLVWAVHFVVVYGLVGVGCDQSWDARSMLGTNLLTALVVAVTLPALAVAAWIGRAGWGWQRRARRPGIDREASRRWRFMGLLTLTVAVIAFVATLMTALPSVMLPPCEVV